MATLTSNISNVSLAVSGNTQKSTTISWSLPTVPSGATITSCTLTGTATASMSKGSATIKVNGTTVSSGSNFTINLGTGNTTSSVTATAKGGNKNASGTVTFSNLVYTVNYSVPLPKYTVTFVDWDGAVLKTQEVEEGSSATAPTSPTRDGYKFTGWDKTFTNITSDLTVTAQYEQIVYYTVTFVGHDGTVLKTQTVESGTAATAPTAPSRTGYTFTGWDKSFSNVTSNLTVTAQYTIKKYYVEFMDYYHFCIKTEWVPHGGSATPPDVPTIEGYTFIGWDTDFTNVTSDLTVTALYSEITDKLKVKENGVWTNIGRIYKKINGVWVGQSISDSDSLFGGNIKYNIGTPNPVAILYSDGTFVFQDSDVLDSSHGDVVGTYTGWGINKYASADDIPWHLKVEKIYNVSVDTIAPLKYASYLFYNMRNSISLDLNSFDTSNVVDMSRMFYSCKLLIELDTSNFNTNNVTNMSYMFSSCSSLTSLDLSNFDTGNVTSMVSMFSSCSSLTSLDLSNFDTGNITSMEWMFRNCSGLTSLDISSFDTSNVTNMNNMFDGCSSLTLLDLSSFDMTNVTNTSYMFRNCTNLQTIYVKDETAKTKIEASSNFPSTATVIIGNPA